MTAAHKIIDDVWFLNLCRELRQESDVLEMQHDTDQQAYWGELLNELTRRGFTLGDL